MGFLSRLFSVSDGPQVGRRQFLQGMLAAAPAAVAAVAAVDLAFVPEIKAAAREELLKLDEMVAGDLGLEPKRILVAAPKKIFDPAARVWRSVAQEAGAWADYVSGQTGVKRWTALTACTRLARLVDDDLRTSEVSTDMKVDVQLPRIIRVWTNLAGEKQCEIGLGLHKEKLFDGTEQFQVKFKNNVLVGRNGKPLVSPATTPIESNFPRGPRGTTLPNGREWDSLGPQEPLPKFEYTAGISMLAP